MEFNYSSFTNREGTFYHPSLDVSFKYKSIFQYKDAIVDTGADLVLIPMSIAEKIGAEPDFEAVTELDCACGNVFKTYASRFAIEIIVDHKGFRPKRLLTHVKIVDAEVPPLLGHRGFLNNFNATFFGKRHVMKLTPS